MTEEVSSNWAQRERPGCVTAYAIIIWIGAGLGLIAGLCGLSGVLGTGGGRLGGFEIIVMGVVLVLVAINVVTGIGLWQMKKWGWAIVIVIHGLSVILGLLTMALTLLTVFSASSELMVAEPTVLCSNLSSLAVSGFILYWFVTNRELFNGEMPVETVIGPDGELVQQPAKKTSDTTMLLAVGGGLVLVLVLVCVVIFAVLAILGPEVGNVFSQITFELENPTTGVIPWLW